VKKLSVIILCDLAGDECIFIRGVVGWTPRKINMEFAKVSRK